LIFFNPDEDEEKDRKLVRKLAVETAIKKLKWLSAQRGATIYESSAPYLSWGKS